jgi:hypothetical protein
MIASTPLVNSLQVAELIALLLESGCRIQLARQEW